MRPRGALNNCKTHHQPDSCMAEFAVPTLVCGVSTSMASAAALAAATTAYALRRGARGGVGPAREGSVGDGGGSNRTHSRSGFMQLPTQRQRWQHQHRRQASVHPWQRATGKFCCSLGAGRLALHMGWWVGDNICMSAQCSDVPWACALHGRFCRNASMVCQLQEMLAPKACGAICNSGG